MSKTETHIRMYETPEGVAVRTENCTIYANVGVSQDDFGLIRFRINKVLPDDRRFLTTFDLDPEMAEILAQRILDLAAKRRGCA